VVKDRELKLAASQTVSDHEVIDFLDNRPQELEREMKKAQEDAAQAKEQVKSGAVGLTAELEQMKQAQSAQEAEAVAAEMEKANTERDQALAQVIEMTALLKQAEDQKIEAEAQKKEAPREGSQGASRIAEGLGQWRSGHGHTSRSAPFA
jgi:hypothetical protein